MLATGDVSTHVVTGVRKTQSVFTVFDSVTASDRDSAVVSATDSVADSADCSPFSLQLLMVVSCRRASTTIFLHCFFFFGFQEIHNIFFWLTGVNFKMLLKFNELNKKILRSSWDSEKLLRFFGDYLGFPTGFFFLVSSKIQLGLLSTLKEDSLLSFIKI